MAKDSKKRSSKLEWFLYIIIIPAIFIAIFTFAFIWFLNPDAKTKILSKINEVPVIEKLIDDEQFKSENATPTIGGLQTEIDKMKVTLSEKDTSIVNFEGNITKKDDEIASLTGQIEELKVLLAEKNTSELEREEELSNLAKVYEKMNAKSAASLLSNLSTEEAVLILNNMGTDAKSKVLEKMDPKKAANYSILLKDQKYDKDADIKALQVRIDELVKKNDDLSNEIAVLMKSGMNLDYEQLATTFANMDPSNAAASLSRMFFMDKEKTIKIFSVMDVNARSQIFNKMDTYDSAKIAQDLLK